jgi:GNAT superfamily N-acetyltransferase
MDGPRACREEELASLRILEDTVFRQGADSTSMFDEFPTLFTPGNCHRLRVMSDGDRVVSAVNYAVRSVSIYGNTLSVASLGGVATYEECRGRGFATTLLEDSFARMREEGVDVVLISGGRGMYLRAGCACGGAEIAFTLGEDAISRLDTPESLSVAEVADREIPAISAIHRHEPARYIRSEGDWRGFISVCRLVFPGVRSPLGAKRCYLVRRDGRPVAYIVMAFDREEAARRAHIVEYAGDRASVFAAARTIADRIGMVSIGGSCLPDDDEAEQVLAEAGATLERRQLGGHTFAVIDEGLMDAFRPWLLERLGPEAGAQIDLVHTDGSWSIAVGEAEISVGGPSQINSLLFGGSVSGLVGPPDAIGTLERVLPLPWLLPGMDYV